MSSTSTRNAFLDAVSAAGRVLRHPAVERRWEEASCLPEWSVRGLAGHLVRGPGQVETYLGDPEPDGETVSAAAYFAIVVDTDDISAPVHRSIRERGEERAARGHAALVADLDGVAARLAHALPAVPEGRRVRVAGDLALDIDEYLCTRIVELALHVDDLAVSVGLDTPPLGPAVGDVAIATLVGVGRLRHGDGAVLRALARRERDGVDALRVL